MEEPPKIALREIRGRAARGLTFLVAYYLAIATGVSLAAGKVKLGFGIFAYGFGIPLSAFASYVLFTLVVFYAVVLVWYLSSERGPWVLLFLVVPLVWHSYSIALPFNR